MRNALWLAGLTLLAGCTPAEPAPPPRATAAHVTPAAAPARAGKAGTAVVRDQRFRAIGTEPFWGIDVLPGRLRYSSPEQPAGVGFAAQTSDGRRFTGTMAGQAVSLVITPGTCSDGMSDTVYAFTAEVTIGALALHGCARKI